MRGSGDTCEGSRSGATAPAERIGYFRAIVDGRWVFVSGTTGCDYSSMAISDDLLHQVRQTIANIGAALAEGADAADVVRVLTCALRVAAIRRRADAQAAVIASTTSCIERAVLPGRNRSQYGSAAAIPPVSGSNPWAAALGLIHTTR